MRIELLGPLYPVCPSSLEAFADIVNTLNAAHNAIELDYNLRILNERRNQSQIAGYYKWIYVNNTFNLWQRISYYSENCFPDQLLKVNFSDISCNTNRGNLLN